MNTGDRIILNRTRIWRIERMHTDLTIECVYLKNENLMCSIVKSVYIRLIRQIRVPSQHYSKTKTSILFQFQSDTIDYYNLLDH